MTCDIISKSDFCTGASLTTLIPEDKLDRKALYTIQEDPPDFILPFHSRSVDGNIELVYQIGRHSKLQYFAGVRSPVEYAQMWSGVLSPLLNCGDWFMKPYSFAVSAEFLYYDKHKKTVSYVYIPSLTNCSDDGDLMEMAAEVSRLIPVTDSNLENRVLRAIMKNFNPQDFLKMLRTYMDENPSNGIPPQKPVVTVPPQQLPHNAVVTVPPQQLAHNAVVAVPPQQNLFQFPQPAQVPRPHFAETTAYGAASSNTDAPRAHNAEATRGNNETQPVVPGDVLISIPANKLHSKKYSEPVKSEKRRKTKEEKAQAQKLAQEQTQAQKLAQEQAQAQTQAQKQTQEQTQTQKQAQAYAYRPAYTQEQDSWTIYPGNNGTSVNYLAIAVNQTETESEAVEEINDTTQSIVIAAAGTRLSYIGRGQMPLAIYIPIKQGEVFTIGRYDTAAGRAQSSFEFDKNTKAVSRRHAAIERCEEGYRIIDLTSSAGTFIDGSKIPPNTPVELEHGCRVSFGNSGADYIWENEQPA